MTILSIVGARPQFIKAAPVSAALRAAGLHEVQRPSWAGDRRRVLQCPPPGRPVETTKPRTPRPARTIPQAIPKPAYNLGVGSGPHGRQTGQILMALEEVLQAERPDWVPVFGDTNSTLAGSLAAVKLGLRVAERLAGAPQLFSAAPGIPWLQRVWEAA